MLKHEKNIICINIIYKYVYPYMYKYEISEISEISEQ